MSQLFHNKALRDGCQILQRENGTYTILIDLPTGHGEMQIYPLSEKCVLSEVDFSLEICPANVVSGFDCSKLITLNYCVEGRCEVNIPGNRAIIVKPGDICLSGGFVMPEEYQYPLKHYRGLEFFFLSTDILDESSFTLLKEACFSFKPWLERISETAVLFDGNNQLNHLMDSLYSLLRPFDLVGCKLRLMEVLRSIQSLGLPAENCRTYYTRTQIAIAKQTGRQITEHPEKEYDLNEIAAHYHISLGTLNNYFRAVYGKYISAYIRESRMKLAASMLEETNRRISEIAAAVGYSNPSKFGKAFKKLYSDTPSEYRRKLSL